MMWHYGYGFEFFPFMPFFGIIFWILLIFLFVRIFRRGDKHFWHDGQSAEEVLKERFARGEIEEKEFKDKMKVLRDHSK